MTATERSPILTVVRRGQASAKESPETPVRMSIRAGAVPIWKTVPGFDRSSSERSRSRAPPARARRRRGIQRRRRRVRTASRRSRGSSRRPSLKAQAFRVRGQTSCNRWEGVIAAIDGSSSGSSPSRNFWTGQVSRSFRDVTGRVYAPGQRRGLHRFRRRAFTFPFGVSRASGRPEVASESLSDI
jgi:hypothetical protein